MRDLLVNRHNGSITKSKCMRCSVLDVKFASAMSYHATSVIQPNTKVSVSVLSRTLGQIAGYMKAANLKHRFVSAYE